MQVDQVVVGDTFRQVPLASLRVDTVLGFDIYIQTAEAQPPVLFREKNLPLTGESLEKLAERHHDFIYIHREQDAEFRLYVETHLNEIVSDTSVSVSRRSEVVYSTAQSLVADVFQEPRSRELIARSRNLVTGVTSFLSNEQSAFQHMLPLVSYDYYTYTHSVNVFVFSVSLAMRAGYTDKDQLQEFGEGVLLHDIGKSMIESDITNAPGKLSAEQWAIMKKHPVYGFDMLKEQNVLGDMALRVVRSHHEKIGGGGYPDGLIGKQIAPLVRITTICDIFDALTTRRSYKPPLDSFPALTLMQNEMVRDLDPQYFKIFVEMMGRPEG